MLEKRGTKKRKGGNYLRGKVVKEINKELPGEKY